MAVQAGEATALPAWQQLAAGLAAAASPLPPAPKRPRPANTDDHGDGDTADEAWLARLDALDGNGHGHRRHTPRAATIAGTGEGEKR